MSNCFVKRREKQLDRERDTVRKGDKVRRVSGDVAELVCKEKRKAIGQRERERKSKKESKYSREGWGGGVVVQLLCKEKRKAIGQTE